LILLSPASHPPAGRLCCLPAWPRPPGRGPDATRANALSILSAAMTLFLMMYPICNVPAFAAFLKDVDPRRRSTVVLRENIIALVVLMFFLLFGPSVLGLLHIEEAALSIAGGVVLFIVALEMIFPGRRSGYHDQAVTGEPFIV